MASAPGACCWIGVGGRRCHDLGVHPKILLPTFTGDSLFSAALTILRVVAVVASLAESGEIEQLRCLGSVIVDVCHGQCDFRACHRMRLVIFATAPFAPILRAIEAHEAAPKFPVLRVASFVLGADRHGNSGDG
jgi:hypothetical protein